ncbi:hypothetical protein [Ferviditalea candida]|uniref:Uncharacterized protein n=1 Tax=Ferviditalea candida TaxID=3108399 RepID=A0ABU5ZGG7_9BACL|nr:hypothetical protein [Paenibacillaceae bacterium T2]
MLKSLAAGDCSPSVYFIPMHYGALRLADDTPRKALDGLEQAWLNRGLPGTGLKILKLGEIFRLQSL